MQYITLKIQIRNVSCVMRTFRVLTPYYGTKVYLYSKSYKFQMQVSGKISNVSAIIPA